jgi:hypothetical protein
MVILSRFSLTAVSLIFCVRCWQIFLIFHTDLSRTVGSNLLFSPSPTAHSAKANRCLSSTNSQISILRRLIRQISTKYSTTLSQNSPKRRLFKGSLQMRKKLLFLFYHCLFLYFCFRQVQTISMSIGDASEPEVKYGDIFPKFIWAPYHCSQSTYFTVREQSYFSRLPKY